MQIWRKMLCLLIGHRWVWASSDVKAIYRGATCQRCYDWMVRVNEDEEKEIRKSQKRER